MGKTFENLDFLRLFPLFLFMEKYKNLHKPACGYMQKLVSFSNIVDQFSR